MKENRGQRAGRVLVAAVGIQFFSGILHVWSIIKDQLIAEYHWSDAQATLPYTAGTLIFAFSMFLAGLIQAKAGPRLLVSLGTSMLGLGLIATGFAQTVWFTVLAFSLIVGVGTGINNAVTTHTAMKWCPPEKKGLITGLVVGGLAIAPVMYSPLATYLLKTFGLQLGLLILGAGALLCSLALAQFIDDPPMGFKPLSKGIGEQETVTVSRDPEFTWRAMLRTPLFYKLFAMFSFSASAGLIVLGHLTQIARLQAGWEGGFLLLMLISVFNTLGRLGGGAISDRIGRINLMRLAFLIQAVNMAVFGLLRSQLTLSLGVAVAGLCYGAVFSVFPATTADYYGLKHLSANYGLIFMGWGLGGVLGPQIASGIFDARGSYQYAYWLAAGLLLAATVLSLTLKKGKGRPGGA